MKNINIFICASPIHIISASNIIHKKQLDNTYCVYVLFPGRDPNEKYRLYLESYSAFFRGQTVIRADNTTLLSLLSLLRISLLFRRMRKTTRISVYTPGIHIDRVRLFCMFLDPQEIYLFDDGLTSLDNPEGVYWAFKGHPIVSLFIAIWDRRYCFPCVKKKINKCFTIYARDRHIMPKDKIEVIGGLDWLYKSFKYPINARQLLSVFKGDKLVILLTQPFSDLRLLSVEEEKKLYAKLVDEYGCNYLLMHPMERRGKYSYMDINIVDTPFITEHVIYWLKRIERRRNIRIVSTLSSSVIHLLLAGIIHPEEVVIYSHRGTEVSAQDIIDKFHPIYPLKL